MHRNPRAIARELGLQDIQNMLAVRRILHIDKIQNNHATQIAQAQLMDDFKRRF